MSRLRSVLLGLALTALLAPAPAGAQEAQPAEPAQPAAPAQPAPQRPGAVVSACQADLEHLCGDLPAGGGGRMRCLRQKLDQASPGCQAQFDPAARERRRERMTAVRAACRNDVSTLCPEVQPGGGGVMRCLRAHGDELSAGCREAIAPPAP